MAQIFLLVKVEWVDSSNTHGWKNKSELDFNINLSCESVGYLIYQDADKIMLAGSITDADKDDYQVNNIFTIPRGAIKQIRYLAESAESIQVKVPDEKVFVSNVKNPPSTLPYGAIFNPDYKTQFPGD